MLALGLAISSCEKDQKVITEELNEETFIWKGQTFKIADTRTKLSLILGVDEKQFVFVPDSNAFRWDRPTSSNLVYLPLDNYMPTIKNIKK